MNWTQFLIKITPALIEFAKELFTRHKGDHEAAKRDIRSRKAAIAMDRAVIDAKMAELKKADES